MNITNVRTKQRALPQVFYQNIPVVAENKIEI
jgi:hypothetical protein